MKPFTATFFAVALAIAVRAGGAESGEPVMYAHYIYVHQGSATLLEFPCGLVLIDAGGQSAEDTANLVAYITRVCSRRGDETRTLKSLIVTHPHADHTCGVRKIAESFHVEQYVDNGQIDGRGPKWIKANANTGGRHINLRSVRETEFAAEPRRVALADAAIDPVQCASCDPQIRILSGGFDDRPGWSDSDVENPNNGSMVVRVDFGRASFLFPGDLEIAGIRDLIREYAGTKLLDVDVYEVGHHGSPNATTAELLAAVTPRIAIISVGKYDLAEESERTSATHYKMPNREVIALLNAAVHERRAKPMATMAATSGERFTPITVKKKIYATGWDGTVKVRASLDGEYDVTTEH